MLGTSVLAGVLVLTGCTVGTPQPTTSAAAAVDAESIVETRTVVAGGGEIEVAIHPLARVGDAVVLTADVRALTVPAGEERVSASGWFDVDAAPDVHVEGGALRLIDAAHRHIHLPAYDDDGDPLGTEISGSFLVDEEGFRLQRVYAAPDDADTSLGLLLPGWYIDALPVIDAEPPAPSQVEEDEGEAIDLADVAEAPVVGLENATRQLDGAVQVIESSEQVEISLSGDVLFEFGSSELGPDAPAVLQAAATTLTTREGGVVDIVGHTDDVGDDASNQTLSEQRAATVASALGDLVDVSSFDLQPSGRGEREPFLPNDSDENRQLNRRVTLTLTTTQIERSEITTTGELPAFEGGPVASGADGVTLDQGEAGTFLITATEAHRTDEMLVVVVEATREGADPYELGWAANLSPGPWSYRGDGAESGLYPFAPRLVTGTTAVYPFDYTIGTAKNGDQIWRLAGQNDAQEGAAGGQTLRFIAIYPDIPGAGTLTLETDGGPGWATSYRLTDIPVE